MIKIITPILLVLLLTSCESKENNQDKTFDTQKVVQATMEKEVEQEAKKIEEALSKPTIGKVEETKKEEETETYAKNIFELTTIDGHKLHVDEVENGIVFQEHKDKVIFLLFFGHRCPPCLSEIPALINIAKEKGENLEIIALEVQRLPEDQLKLFKASKKLNYTVLSGENEANSEFISYIAQRAQWSGSIPFLVGITPKGDVGLVHVGGMSSNELHTVFDQLSK